MISKFHAIIRRRGWPRVALEALCVVQVLHLGEHVAQMIQLYVLGWPPAVARGVVSNLDVEKVHFVWNLAVLVTLIWLARHGLRNGWLLATLAWATLHTSEHAFLLTNALLRGVEGQPGILGAGGSLARHGWNVPGVTTWSRAGVHFAWNTVEVALLVLAYAAFASERWRPRPDGRGLAAIARRSLRGPAPALFLILLALLALLVKPDSASVQGGPTRYVNHGDPTCGGHAPCYPTIQAAVNAVLASETILIQAGTYAEQVSIQGKNNVAAASEADRIVVMADPAAPLGSVVITGGTSACTNGHAIRLQQSKYVTLRGLTITGAGGQAIALLGGNNQNQAIHIERNRIFDNGGAECNGGITVNRGNPGTLIVNNLIYGNGRNGITFLDADGGPHYLVQNTIHANAWSGVSVARSHEVFLVNNAITGNGVSAGATGGRFGVTREASSAPQPSTIHLLHNLVCGNRLGEIDGPALDGTDAGNLTPTGGEGAGVGASAGCQIAAKVYAQVAGPDGSAGTADDDFTPAATSPVIDRGVDPRTLGFDPRFTALFEADFAAERVRPTPGTGTGTAQFDIGAIELATPDTQGPTVTILQPPAGAFVRQSVTVRAEATDGGSGVASLALSADGAPLATAITPPPPAATVTGTAAWNTTSEADGAHTLSAIATDRAGNSRTVTRTVIVDNSAPDTQIVSGPSGDVADTSAVFAFTGSDNLTLVTSLAFAWRLDGAPFGTFSTATTASVTGLAEGSHTFEVKARDLAGNEAPMPAAQIFTVSMRPTIATLSPSGGPVGTLVTISGSGFVPGATQVSFNGVAAVIRSITPTTLTATVPLDAHSGPVTVATARGAGTSVQPFTVTLSEDFSIQAVPANAQLVQATSTTYTIALPGAGSTPFTGLATLSVTGLSPGVTGVFAPAATVSGSQLRTLTLTAAPSATVGLVTLTISASATVNATSVTRTAAVTVNVLSGGRTAALGQVTFADGTPIAGVRLTLAGATTTSDSGGNFRLLDVPAGPQMLGVDANAAQAGLPIYGVDVTLVAGQATQLAPFRITPPPPLERFAPIANGATAQVISDPRFPGASITLPAGVTITGWDGTVKTRIALERLSPEALPVPPPPGVTRSLYQVFFGTPMGGLPSAPLPVTVPNDQDLEPGEKAEIWYYDAAPVPGVPAGWRLAGLGTVSPDGSRVVSDPGVGISRFCGVCGVFCIIPNVNKQRNVNPRGPKAGEPVDLGTGLMVVDKTDLVLPGRLPAIVRRTYNPLDPFGRVAGFELATGPGWTLTIDVVLLQESSSLRRLILPGNSRFVFALQPDGTFTNTTFPDFAGAVLRTQPDGGHTLRFKDGTTWRFATGYVPRVGVPVTIFGLSLLVAQSDRSGNTLTITRDRFGAPTQVTEPGGRALSFTVDLVDAGVGRLLTVTDPIGRTVRYGYAATAPFRLETVTDPLGGLTRYTYNAAGGIVGITDPRGITFLTNEYDQQGRVVRQTQADGGVWTFAYTGPAGAHSTATVVDPRGHPSVHRLDNAGFANELLDPLGQLTRHERDAVGRVTATTDSLGRTTRVAYDVVGNVTRVTDPVGNVRTFTYEPTFNRVTSTTDPLDQVTRLEYDATGNLTAIVNPLGHRTTLTYNGVGQPLTVTDPLGNVTRFEYDTVGNLTATVDAVGNRTTREYDAVSRLSRQRNALAQGTTFGYDALNRVETVLDGLAGVTRFAYDGNGNLLTVTDARGSATTHTYDAMDRLATRTDPVGATESFGYDPLGNSTRHTDRKGQVATFAYDALNRRTRGSYVDATTDFAYDGSGRLVYASDSVGGTILNQYDTLNRLLAQTTSLGVVAYEYDSLGRRTTMTASGQPPVTYTYDTASRLTSITQANQLVQFQHDPAGRRTRLTLPNQVSTEYQYDLASRLTALIYRNAAGVLGDLIYQYDTTGKRVAVGGSFARTLLPDPVTSATYDAANRHVNWNGISLTYDANGNLTAAGPTAYTWDARNRMSGLSNSGGIAVFAYDPLSRRLRKKSDGSETRFHYDGVNPIQLLSATGGAGSILVGLGLDEFFVSAEAADQRSFLTDALGSTIAELDSTAAATAEYTYDPSGRTSVMGTTQNPFQYTGRENDATGLYYYRARYYHPTLRRFLSEDPMHLPMSLDAQCGRAVAKGPTRYIQIDQNLMSLFSTGFTSLAASAVGMSPQSMNLHAYADNDPINKNDPTGLWSYPQIRGCDWPARPVQWLNPCAKSCCDAHDRCYEQAFQFCDQSSWNYTLAMHGARPVIECNRCNAEVVGCILQGNTIGGRKGCPVPEATPLPSP